MIRGWRHVNWKRLFEQANILFEIFAVLLNFRFACFEKIFSFKRTWMFLYYNLKGMIYLFIYYSSHFWNPIFTNSIIHWKLIQITDYAYYLEHSCQLSTLFGSFNQNKSMKISYIIYPIYYLNFFCWDLRSIEFSAGFLCSSLSL